MTQDRPARPVCICASSMHMWGLPRLQCARGNLYFCSSEPEPTESKGRLVIGTRLKASRGQGGGLNPPPPRGPALDPLPGPSFLYLLYRLYPLYIFYIAYILYIFYIAL